MYPEHNIGKTSEQTPLLYMIKIAYKICRNDAVSLTLNLLTHNFYPEFTLQVNHTCIYLDVVTLVSY